MQSAFRTIAVAVVLLGGGAACQTQPRLIGRDVEVLNQGRIAALNPADVAVAPVLAAETVVDAPLGRIRRAAQNGLVLRRYSPLANSIVDDAIGEGTEAPGIGTVEASYLPGDLGEDAVLEVVVERWNDANWGIRGALDVALQARMIDAKDPLGPSLWEARIDKTFQFGRERRRTAGGAIQIQNACDSIMAELFSKLPARDTSFRESLDLSDVITPGEGQPAGGPEAP